MTLKKTLVDTINPAFSHGHAFVATSRVRDKDGLKFFCSQSSIHPNGFQTGDMPLMTNVVYKDLLSHIGIGINNQSTHSQPHPPIPQHLNLLKTKERNIPINCNHSSIPAMEISKSKDNNPAKLAFNNNGPAISKKKTESFSTSTASKK